MTMLDDAPETLQPGRTDDVLFAERAVLGSMIASASAAERVLEVIDRDDCFSEGIHRAVFAAVRYLTEEGGLPVEWCDLSANEADLEDGLVRTRFADVLARLIAAEQGVWRTGQAGVILGDLMGHASAAYMTEAAKVLRAAQQRWVLSALITARQMAAKPGFDAAEDGDMLRKVVEDALAVPSLRSDAVTAADLFLSTVERLESPEPPGVIQFPWAELRRLVPYCRAGQLVSILARPSLGKSLVAQDTARYNGLRRQIPGVLFTLEQDRDEVMDRLLAAEAGVLLEHITGKELTDGDWSRIAAAKDRFEASNFVIDDAPKITIPHIRARLRGMARRDPAQWAIVDYLQLMDGGPQAESRQREVAALVGDLKGIAREFRIPVVMCCQLNRGPEHRQDKRPHVSDARETGCMPASTRLMRADNGAEVTLGELVLSQEQPMVLSVDPRQRLVASRLTRTFPSGIKPVFRLRLASGRTVDATANHQFLTIGGWERLDALAKGSFIAVPRSLGEPPSAQRMDEDELILMAHLIGDGSIGPSVKYTTADPANKDAVEDSALRRFGIRSNAWLKQHTWQIQLPSPYQVTHNRYHPMRNWLEPYGLWGSRAWTKFLPGAIFGLPDDQLALFLRHLWATDGSITMLRNGRGALVSTYYATTSRRLADDVQRALLRFGVRTTIRPSRKTGYRICWHVVVQGSQNQVTFLTRIGCHGARGEVIPEALDAITRLTPNPNLDLVPQPVAALVREALQRAGISHRALASALGERYCGGYLLGRPGKPRRFSRPRLARMAEITSSDELMDIAQSDLYWDAVAEITPLGLMPTFDATVEETHNFIADGIVAHNSVENDSDVAILIHREDFYESESPRAGEADLIVDKNRNGPRGTATIRFQGHYARFVDPEWTPSSAIGAQA